MRQLVPAALAAVLLGVAGQASAEIVTAQRVDVARPVAVAATDFRDSGQVEALYARIQRAALQVCMSPDLSFADRAARDADRACAQRALAAAVAKMDRPMLTARYQRQDAPILARGY